MKKELKTGMTFEFTQVINENKTVPYIFPEIEETHVMPRVLATGFMIGLFELACVRALKEYLDWPNEMTVGTYVNFSHLAATPPGFDVTVRCRLDKIEGKKLTFYIEADDGVDKISEGTHIRYIINEKGFNKQVEEKKQKLKL
ncbi:MAG: thioesterase family protein [Desulfobacterales bacterium]|nr:thioesterase family protein [Desulfobacterales bacterium]MCP4161730.1 thioesterase family protein [Deltaproteobacteria bacterium]